VPPSTHQRSKIKRGCNGTSNGKNIYEHNIGIECPGKRLVERSVGVWEDNIKTNPTRRDFEGKNG
jgi:hypothetical protein